MSSPKDEEIKALAKQLCVHQVWAPEIAWQRATEACLYFDAKVRELIAAREAAAAEKRGKP
jgi:hypothetical protein